MKCKKCENEAIITKKSKHLCQECLDKRIKHHKERAKAYIEEKKAKGICSKCSNKAAEGKTICQVCLDNAKLHKEKKRSIGICINCTNKVVEGLYYCQVCLDKSNLYKQTKKKNGICVDCCKEAIEGKTICQECSDLKKATVKEKIAKGICRHCQNKARDGKTICEKCAEISRKRTLNLINNWREHVYSNPLGVCGERGCTNTPINGYTCEYHLNKRREDNIKRKEKRIQEKLCVRCGRPVVYDGLNDYITCHKCRLIRSTSNFN